MATAQFQIVVGGSDAYGVPLSISSRQSGDPVALAVTVAAAVAVLVADGATPTQAHVTTLNTAYTALAATQMAAADGVGISINTANVTTRNQLKNVFDRFMVAMQGRALLTP
jgi:hypothetical protein